MTVNERFEVFFPEPRSFFVENAGFFVTPTTLFFSRRIHDPAGGVRLTGKAGPWVTAALAMHDRATPETGAATVAVASVRRELAGEAHIGALVTSRESADASSRVASVDGRCAIGKTWAVLGQAMRSSTVVPGSERANGTGYVAEVSRNGRHLDLSGRFTDLSPDFEAAVGFVRRVDIRQLNGETACLWRPRSGMIAKHGPKVDTFAIWDHGRTLQEWRVRPRFEVALIGQTTLLVDQSVGGERYRGIDFGKRRTTAEIESEWTRWSAFSASYEQGTDINRRPPAGEPPSLADRRSTELVASLKPGRRVQLDQTYLHTRLTTRRNTAGASAAVFDNRIVRTKLKLQFTRAVSIRGIFDYETVTANAAVSSLKPRRGVRH